MNDDHNPCAAPADNGADARVETGAPWGWRAGLAGVEVLAVLFVTVGAESFGLRLPLDRSMAVLAVFIGLRLAPAAMVRLPLLYWLCGIRLVGADGQPAARWRAVLRAAVPTLSGLLLILMAKLAPHPTPMAGAWGWLIGASLLLFVAVPLLHFITGASAGGGATCFDRWLSCRLVVRRLATKRRPRATTRPRR